MKLPLAIMADLPGIDLGNEATYAGKNGFIRPVRY